MPVRTSLTVLLCAIVLMAAVQVAPADKPDELLKQMRLSDATLEDQRALLDRIEQQAPDSAEALAAKGYVARKAYSEGKSDEALALWMALSEEAPWVPTPGSGNAGMWAQVMVNGAARQVAQLHEERGDWRQALAWWRRYEPAEPCGTGTMLSRRYRAERIRMCAIRIGAPWADERLLAAANWYVSGSRTIAPLRQ